MDLRCNHCFTKIQPYDIYSQSSGEALVAPNLYDFSEEEVWNMYLCGICADILFTPDDFYE